MGFCREPHFSEKRKAPIAGAKRIRLGGGGFGSGAGLLRLSLLGVLAKRPHGRSGDADTGFLAIDDDGGVLQVDVPSPAGMPHRVGDIASGHRSLASERAFSRHLAILLQIICMRLKKRAC